MATPFIIGAYASLPANDQEYYELLHSSGWVDGIEIPFPGQLAEPSQRALLAEHIRGRFSNCLVTAIPGTMQRVWASAQAAAHTTGQSGSGADAFSPGAPTFGLASLDEGGRQDALAFTQEIRQAVREFNAATDGAVTRVALHSAPTAGSSRGARAEAFTRSLEEIVGWDWDGAEIIIEHCDAFTKSHTPEKGFLTLLQELEVARSLDLKVSINWGRSAVESRGADLPQEHIHLAAEDDLLAGVIFSGASPSTTAYGGPWADGHLPLSTDEPTSIMTPEAVAAGSCAAHQAPSLGFLGAKICVPEQASPADRLAMLERIYRATQVR